MVDKFGIAIAGTHGKTTTSTMISLILEEAGKEPTILIGGEVKNIGGNFKMGAGDYFVAEACEYDRSFLDLFPKAGVITNIEADHLDYYRDLSEIKEAFRQFALKIPKEGFIVVWADDQNINDIVNDSSSKIITYGLNKGVKYQVVDIDIRPGRVKFKIADNLDLGEFSLKIPGVHNILDATASIAVSLELGIDVELIRKVLDEFEGVERRFQIKGEVKGITIIDDYGHHPTEIRATLEGAKQFYPKGRIICVFEPHQYSRTRYLLEDFAKSFGDADLVIIPDIYRMRDSDEEVKRINSEVLVSEIQKYNPNSKYLGKYDEIIDFLSTELKTGDILVTMGAGNIYKVGEEAIKKLKIKN